MWDDRAARGGSCLQWGMEVGVGEKSAPPALRGPLGNPATAWQEGEE